MFFRVRIQERPGLDAQVLFDPTKVYLLGGHALCDRDAIADLADPINSITVSFACDVVPNYTFLRPDGRIAYFSRDDSVFRQFVCDSCPIWRNGMGVVINGRDNAVFKSSTGLRYEITDLLYGNFQVDYDYESEPAATADNEDLAVLLGFGLEF